MITQNIIVFVLPVLPHLGKHEYKPIRITNRDELICDGDMDGDKQLCVIIRQHQWLTTLLIVMPGAYQPPPIP